MAESRSSAIILAGGKSERMGQDKALLVYDGMTFLEHIIASMLSICDDIIVVADRPDRYALSSGRLVVDVFSDAGPVGGILTGLLSAGAGTHFVVPCDMPAVKPQIFELFQQALVPPLDAVVPEIGGRTQFLCGAYAHSSVPKLRAYLESGQRSAQGALAALEVMRMGEEALRCIEPNIFHLANINTPADFAAFRRSVSPPHRPIEIEL